MDTTADSSMVEGALSEGSYPGGGRSSGDPDRGSCNGGGFRLNPERM